MSDLFVYETSFLRYHEKHQPRYLVKTTENRHFFNQQAVVLMILLPQSYFPQCHDLAAVWKHYMTNRGDGVRVTVEEIAKIAGVSKATVSRVLNHSDTGVSTQTREKVQRIIDEMHYSPDHIGIQMQSKSIGLVVPDITNPFFADIARAVANRAICDNYVVILMNTDFSEEKELEYISTLIAKKVDGIILIPSGSESRKGHFAPQKYGIPLVLLDRKLNRLDFCTTICSDNEYAAFCSCELLIKNGSRSIAFISGPLRISTSAERLAGYKLALEQYGIPFEQDMVKIGDYTVESGYNAVLELEKEGIEYSAVLAANDMMALGALRALKEFSYKIPETKEIIGFDNINFSQYCEPPLSTIQQPTAEMGKKATEVLIKMINGDPVPSYRRLQPKMILRKTTK